MTGGIIATSDPRASRVGAEKLLDGGNALDAAVAAAVALFVLEPHACGLGGDAFVLLKTPTEAPIAIDGSGAVPASLAAAAVEEDF
jgi:gamma-glutamyltranspeptidase / glutathione hydrolase